MIPNETSPLIPKPSCLPPTLDLQSTSFQKTDALTEPSTRTDAAAVQQCSLLALVTWISMILFGSFALFQYILPALVIGDWDRWEKTDAGLYRPTRPAANRLMVIHMCFGVFLQIVGPIQLIPYVRKNYLRFHRWIGRVYIGSALLTSGCATLYVVLYRTSRRWIHEDIGNIIFGVSVFLSATLSLYHILNGRVEAHKVWSFRLFLAVFGATLVRVLAVPYFLGLYLGASARQWVVNGLFYTIVIPSWIGYEVIRLRSSSTNMQDTQHYLQLGGVIGLGVLSLIIFVFAWLPSILDTPSVQSSLSDQYRDPKL